MLTEADPEARIDSEVSCQPKQSKLDTDAWLVCPLCPSRLFSSRYSLHSVRAFCKVKIKELYLRLKVKKCMQACSNQMQVLFFYS